MSFAWEAAEGVIGLCKGWIGLIGWVDFWFGFDWSNWFDLVWLGLVSMERAPAVGSSRGV